MSSATGGAAAGLNALGGVVGLAGSLVPTAQGRQDRRITNGQEDPAIAALRRRLAAQNAQTAMAVAASQQGVNPALAQRNAQQALAQQQVQTNANLAQHNAQSTQASRNATRTDQSRRMQAATAGMGTLLTGLGTSLGAQAAYDASGAAPAEGAAGLAPPSPTAQPVAAAPQALMAAPPQPAPAEGTGGLATPVPSASLGAPPQQPSAAAAQETLSPVPMEPAGQMQMRGGEAQLTTEADFVQALRGGAPEAVTVPPVQEAAVAQAAPVPAQIPQAAPAPAEVPALTPEQAAQAMDPSVFDDPINSSINNMAMQLRDNGNLEMADIFYRALRQRVSGNGG